MTAKIQTRHYNMLRVCSQGTEKLYIDGRNASRKRWDHMHRVIGGDSECMATEVKKDGRVFHRHARRVPTVVIQPR